MTTTCAAGHDRHLPREVGAQARVWNPKGSLSSPITTSSRKTRRRGATSRSFASSPSRRTAYFYDPGPRPIRASVTSSAAEGHARRARSFSHRLAHVHAWRVRPVCDRDRQHRCRFVMERKVVGESSADYAIRVRWTHAALPDGKGPDPPRHRDIGVDAPRIAHGFLGNAVDEANMDERMTLCNMPSRPERRMAS